MTDITLPLFLYTLIKLSESVQSSKTSNSNKPSIEAGGTVDSDSEYNDTKKYPSGACLRLDYELVQFISLMEGTLMPHSHHSHKSNRQKHNNYQ